MHSEPDCSFCGIVAGARVKDRLGADGVNLLNCSGIDEIERTGNHLS